MFSKNRTIVKFLFVLLLVFVLLRSIFYEQLEYALLVAAALVQCFVGEGGGRTRRSFLTSSICFPAGDVFPYRSRLGIGAREVFGKDAYNTAWDSRACFEHTS